MTPLPFYWVRSLRFLLPSGNPLGWSAADLVLGLLAAVLFAGLWLWPKLRPLFDEAASSAFTSMTICGVLPVALRLALLGSHPVPSPNTSDDFSYLLMGDTLAHFRLANPVHPMNRFFEGVFTLQQPSWSSIFPMGQGIALAFGQILFDNPWAGVVISVGVFCALCCWMLRGWTRPAWALTGGLLAAIQFGPLSAWMNTYWGGAVSGCAGCLVFGALPRLKEQPRLRDAVLLGVGLGLELITRPFEFVVLCVVVAGWFALGLGRTPPATRPSTKLLIAVTLAFLPAAALTLAQNYAVTGNALRLPYIESRYQYGIPTTFTFQANPIPHRELTVEQQTDYNGQVLAHGRGPETLSRWLARLGDRIRFLRFFFLPPLYLALLGFLFALRERRWIWIAVSVALFGAADNFYPFFYPHYVAAVACVFMLIAVEGLMRMREIARVLLLLTAGYFLLWYGIHLSGNQDLMAAAAPYESSDVINYGDPEGHLAINNQLDAAPGLQLVFVHFYPQHGANEWIHNAADIDHSRVVWAIDRGDEEDAKLRAYYPSRKVWTLEPDARPPRLTPQ